jgi:Icc protein
MPNLTLDRKSFLRSLAMTGAAVALPSASLFASDSPTPARRRLLRVAHITDIHVMPGRVPEYGMATALHEVNALADRPDFAIAGGDMIMDSMSTARDKVKEMWRTFHGIMKADNSLDVHHTIGNHDIFNIGKSAGAFADGKKWACEEFQIPHQYYTFDKGRWRFIILDSVHTRGVPGYIGRLDEEQMAWLKQTLTATPAGMYVCVVSHIPLLAVCTTFDGSRVRGNQWRIGGGDLHEDAREVKDLFHTTKNVKACLSGHIHLISALSTTAMALSAAAGGLATTRSFRLHLR